MWWLTVLCSSPLHPRSGPGYPRSGAGSSTSNDVLSTDVCTGPGRLSRARPHRSSRTGVRFDDAAPSAEHGGGHSHGQTMMRDLRTNPSTDDGDALRALPPDQLQAVVPTISASTHHDARPALDGPGPGEPVFVESLPALDVASLALPGWPFGRVGLALAAAAVVAVLLATGEVFLGLASGALVCASRGVAIDHRSADPVLVRAGLRRLSTGSRVAAGRPGGIRRPLGLAAASGGRGVAPVVSRRRSTDQRSRESRRS